MKDVIVSTVDLRPLLKEMDARDEFNKSVDKRMNDVLKEHGFKTENVPFQETHLADMKGIPLTDEIPEEWSGSPCPIDPDNFWIDDETCERVNACTGKRSKNNQEFVGYHRFRADDGSEHGSFKVYRLDEEVGTADEAFEPGWYWVSEFPGCLPDGDANGPFPTAEGAFLDAIGD